MSSYMVRDKEGFQWYVNPSNTVGSCFDPWTTFKIAKQLANRVKGHVYVPNTKPKYVLKDGTVLNKDPWVRIT